MYCPSWTILFNVLFCLLWLVSWIFKNLLLHGMPIFILCYASRLFVYRIIGYIRIALIFQLLDIFDDISVLGSQRPPIGTTPNFSEKKGLLSYWHNNTKLFGDIFD